MGRRLDHIDLRARCLAEVTPFYEALLPALGFTRRDDVEGWLQFVSEEDPPGEFFGVTESPSHVPNENRVSFRAESMEKVGRLAELALKLGARNMEGPMDYSPGYYAVFFEDPSGNRLEICCREPRKP